MHVLSRLVAASALSLLAAASPVVLPASSSKATLYVSHYDGHVFSLTLDAAKGSLTQIDSLQACGDMPSWLTYDSSAKTLYCVDESGTSANVGNGTLSSFATTANGSLAQVAKTTTLPGGVNSVIYEDRAGKKYLAIAHYEGSAVSNFELPISSTSTALQTFEFVLTAPGTDPSRQDAPHPHEVFLDPTRAFVLNPDLGADLVHIFAIDKSNGKLNECASLEVKPGNGPRHGTFWTSDHNDSTVLYIVNELANTVSIYKANYGGACLSFEDAGDIVPYPTDVPSTANVAEIRIVADRDVYVSVRNDQAFPPDDSMAFLEASATNGSLTFKNLTTSYGKTPRTFAVNNAGTLIAIGDQASSNVAVVQRDMRTGALGRLVANLQVGTPGTPGQSNGLSSVIWAE